MFLFFKTKFIYLRRQWETMWFFFVGSFERRMLSMFTGFLLVSRVWEIFSQQTAPLPDWENFQILCQLEEKWPTQCQLLSVRHQQQTNHLFIIGLKLYTRAWLWLKKICYLLALPEDLHYLLFWVGGTSNFLLTTGRNSYSCLNLSIHEKNNLSHETVPLYSSALLFAWVRSEVWQNKNANFWNINTVQYWQSAMHTGISVA